MFTRRELATLTLFCAVYVSWGLTDSIQAPFYPREASEIGATPSEYGFVFGIIHLAIFICGPIFGKYMHRLGVRRVYFYGVIQTAICALLFGLLDFVKDKTLFLAFSYVLRILEGVAEAASWSAVFAMLLTMFPNNVATIYAITEASFSFAEMIGPTFGAVLYEAGGFVLPFGVCGSFCLLTGLFTICVLPSQKELMKSAPIILIDSQTSLVEETQMNNNAENSKLLSPHPDSIVYTGSNPTRQRQLSNMSEATSTRSYRSHRTSIHSKATRRTDVSFASILFNGNVLMALSGTVMGASVQGFLEATLEQYLEVDFGLSISKIGFTFLALSVPYFFASPLWGHVCDHYVNPKIIQPLGHVTTIVGFVLLGPVGYIPESVLPPAYVTTVIGLCFLGIGTAALLVASFSGAQRAALESLSVEPDDVYAIISGIWTSSFALGNFIGPTVGGILVGSMGFRNSTTVFQAASGVLCILDLINLLFCGKSNGPRKAVVPRRKSKDKMKITAVDVQYDLYERMP